MTDSTDEDFMTVTRAQCNSTSNSTSTSNINFNGLVGTKKKIRDNIELSAVSGQEKQAVLVNKETHLNGGEHLPKDTTCTLKLSRDRNKIGIKTPPVVMTQVVFQKKQIKFDTNCAQK